MKDLFNRVIVVFYTLHCSVQSRLDVAYYSTASFAEATCCEGGLSRILRMGAGQVVGRVSPFSTNDMPIMTPVSLRPSGHWQARTHLGSLGSLRGGSASPAPTSTPHVPIREWRAINLVPNVVLARCFLDCQFARLRCMSSEDSVFLWLRCEMHHKPKNGSMGERMLDLDSRSWKHDKKPRTRYKVTSMASFSMFPRRYSLC